MSLTKADLDAAILDVQVRSVTMYLERQDLEQTRIQVQQRIFRTDQQLIALDGELAALTALAAKAINGQ